jgi:hypothetical protein
MLIEEVDAVGAESLEGGVSNFLDLFGPAIDAYGSGAAVRVQFESELGGDHDLVTKRFERLANQLLVGVGTIDLSSIEESYAPFHGATEELNHFAAVARLAVSPTHTHASEAKR